MTYQNQDSHAPPKPIDNRSMSDKSQDALSFCIAGLVSFFIGIPLFNATTPFVPLVIANMTEQVILPEFGQFLWGFVLFVGLFFATFSYAHLKLTIRGIQKVNRALDPDIQQKKKSGAGAFWQVVGVLLLLFALGSLSGCKDHQIHERLMQQDVLDHNRSMKQDHYDHEENMANGRGAHERAMKDKEHEEAEKIRIHEMTMEQVALAATQAAQDAYHKFMTSTVAPTALYLSGIIAFSGLAGFGWFRFCTMCERVAVEKSKAAVANAFVAGMSSEERQQAFAGMIASNDVIDMRAIREV